MTLKESQHHHRNSIHKESQKYVDSDDIGRSSKKSIILIQFCVYMRTTVQRRNFYSGNLERSSCSVISKSDQLKSPLSLSLDPEVMFHIVLLLYCYSRYYAPAVIKMRYTKFLKFFDTMGNRNKATHENLARRTVLYLLHTRKIV